MRSGWKIMNQSQALLNKSLFWTINSKKKGRKIIPTWVNPSLHPYKLFHLKENIYHETTKKKKKMICIYTKHLQRPYSATLTWHSQCVFAFAARLDWHPVAVGFPALIAVYPRSYSCRGQSSCCWFGHRILKGQERCVQAWQGVKTRHETRGKNNDSERAAYINAERDGLPLCGNRRAGRVFWVRLITLFERQETWTH